MTMTKPYDDDTSEKVWSKLHVLAEVASIFYNELQRTKKGKSKTVYEERVDTLNRLFHSVPRKARSGLNRPSPSSSLLLPLPWHSPTNPSEPSSSRVLVAYESQKTEMKYPPNPSSPSSLSSYVTEPKSLKRRAVKENKRPGNSKKARTVPLSWKGRDAPESLLKVMRELDAADQKPELIFERSLYKTDVDRGQSRLSMPVTQIIGNTNFLIPNEVDILEQDIEKGNKVGVEAFLVNEKAQMWRVFLKRWESRTSWNYSVTCGWNDFVAANGLEQGHGISVWTFRCHGILCFAVIPPPQK